MLSNHLLPLSFLLPALATAAPGFVAYKELTCQDPIDIFADGEPIPDNKLKIDRAITDWDSHAGGRYYDNLTFPDAAISGDDNGVAGTQFIYWGVEEPDPGCQFIMMKDTQFGWQILNKMPGTEILRVAKEGCYYTPLTAHDGLITSYCCGQGDCSIAEVEIQSNPPKDAVSGEPPACTIKSSSASPTIEDGQQIAITRPQTCEAAPACTHSIQLSTTVTTAVAHFNSYTWTSEMGTEISFESGIDFIGQDKMSSTMSSSLAQSWMQETGSTVTVGNITAATEGNRQMPGTVAFYSFVPHYECWKADMDCGKDSDGNEVVLERISFCQPRLSSTGEADGIFRMVYISE
ncbi:Histone transcription regulator 3 [Hypoxylon texense]